MKKRANWLVVPALVLTLGACKKKEEAPAPASTSAVAPAGGPVVPAVPVTPPVPVIPALSAEERAAKLGFAKFLPQDTETLISYYQGSQTTKRLKSSQLWKFIEQEVGAGGEVEPPADPAVEPFGPAALFGTEFTLALGKSTSQQMAGLLTLNSRSTYFQMRGLVKSFAAAIKSGDASTIGESFTNKYGQEMVSELLHDPKSGIDVVEKLQMPAIYLAF